MRLWTYLLPTGLWLWLVRRSCERVTLPGGLIGFDAGRIAVVVVPPGLAPAPADRIPGLTQMAMVILLLFGAVLALVSVLQLVGWLPPPATIIATPQALACPSPTEPRP